MKRPDLPAEHCANQSPETVKKVFVQSIAPSLKSGSMDARSAISQLEKWRKYHPEVFADWRELCLTYIQQPPEWVDWLIQGVRATSEEVVEADKLVAAGTAVMAEKHAQQMLALETPRFAPEGKPRKGLEGNLNNVKVTECGLGNSVAYLTARLKKAQRDDLLAEIGPNKRFKSARAAAIEAGIITPFPSLQLKEPAPTAQKLLDKKGQAWCLQLLEELSELCL
jgi:hypothetical protein